MLLLIDNYDSFTYNLRDYFIRLGEEVILVKNDQLTPETLGDYVFDKVVISPGPNTPSESGNLMALLPHICGKYPVLGVCLGHQALGQYYGAELKLAIKPMHGKVSTIQHDGKGIYKNIVNPLDVCRYHSLIIDTKQVDDLIITAKTDQGECMSFVHRSHQVTGIQYHPEAILTAFGIELLDNWLRSI